MSNSLVFFCSSLISYHFLSNHLMYGRYYTINRRKPLWYLDNVTKSEFPFTHPIIHTPESHSHVVETPKERIYGTPYEAILCGLGSFCWINWRFSCCNPTFRFLKSSAFEIDIDNGISEEGRYSPRFINEIAEEIDVLEDKKAPLFSKYNLCVFFLYSNNTTFLIMHAD